jgi:hypothetical protein
MLMNWIIKATAIIVFGMITATATGQSPLVWLTKGKDFHDAIPLGNGDVGISAWVQKDGDLLFYISKTDAYDDNNRLLKLGRIRVKILPNPFVAGKSFRQELNLRRGEMNILAGAGSDQVSLRIWVDANNPAVQIAISGNKEFQTIVSLEDWRKQEHVITDTAFSDPFSNSIDGSLSTIPAIQYPDHIVKSQPNRIVWYHQNIHSTWPAILRLQGLGDLIPTETDPLQDRIFGGSISGKGLIKQDDTTFVSIKAGRNQKLMIIALTGHPVTSDSWLETLKSNGEIIKKQDPEKALAAHYGWWKQFWNRSWVDIHTDGDTGSIMSRSYALQRWIVACGGRGNGWTKFNGSIFTLPWEVSDPDYRRWGSANWFQNVRLLYWPLIATGDFDMTAPFFGTYLSALPLASRRAELYYGHKGAFYPETLYSWGSNTNGDYGYDRMNKSPGFVTNSYVRHYWSGGLELSAMMLDQYDITRSQKFLTDTLLPLAGAIVRFYGEHWKKGPDGKIVFDSAQSLETWQAAVNPLPEIAGLRYVLGRLLELPNDARTDVQRSFWTRTLADLPSVPTNIRNDSVFLMPADSFGEKSNSENPELYAVFPYRLYGAGKPHLQTGLNSFAEREFRENRCWWQDEIQAACLGLARQAANGLAKRLSDWNKDFRFPAMWGPNNDELPDLDHGGVGQMALQYMLLQSDQNKIFLFPAWPRSWEVSFKLHAPQGTTITGELKGGKLQNLIVVPQSRRKDIIIMPIQ